MPIAPRAIPLAPPAPDISDSLIGPLLGLLDRILPDPAERDRARLALLDLQGSQALALVGTQLAAITTEAASPDPWTSRARPTFLYVMYAMLLCALPMGMLNAINPATASAVITGMDAYLAGIPQPLYTLFGAGYLGYTAARQWGKVAGSDR